MTVYEFRCRACGDLRESTNPGDVRACPCGGESRRYYGSVQMGPNNFQPHFNHAVGQYVSSARQFEDALKSSSDRNSAATGMDHNYVRVDPGDIPRPAAATEAFETREKFITDNKINPATLNV